jgi:hypothetical protein
MFNLRESGRHSAPTDAPISKQVNILRSIGTEQPSTLYGFMITKQVTEWWEAVSPHPHWFHGRVVMLLCVEDDFCYVVINFMVKLCASFRRFFRLAFACLLFGRALFRDLLLHNPIRLGHKLTPLIINWVVDVVSHKRHCAHQPTDCDVRLWDKLLTQVLPALR